MFLDQALKLSSLFHYLELCAAYMDSVYTLFLNGIVSYTQLKCKCSWYQPRNEWKLVLIIGSWTLSISTNVKYQAFGLHPHKIHNNDVEIIKVMMFKVINCKRLMLNLCSWFV